MVLLNDALAFMGNAGIEGLIDFFHYAGVGRSFVYKMFKFMTTFPRARQFSLVVGCHNITQTHCTPIK